MDQLEPRRRERTVLQISEPPADLVSNIRVAAAHAGVTMSQYMIDVLTGLRPPITRR